MTERPEEADMRRTVYGTDHEDFRRIARNFFEKECASRAADWERQGHVDRDVWRRAGQAGLVLWELPEEYGGTGIKDFRYNAALIEEMYGSGSPTFGLGIQNDIIPSYLRLADDAQAARWFPSSISGESIWALAISEPGAGSDVRSLRTTARRDGDTWVLNGSKTFITNGVLADLVVVAAKTGPDTDRENISLFVVERDMPGFERGRPLHKVGQHAQDTAELSFNEVRVPAENLLGAEGKGFSYLMRGLGQERLTCSLVGVAVMERAFALTADYVRTRQVFGRPVGAYQNTRFELADMKTVIDVARVYADRAVEEHCEGRLTAEEAAGFKQWATDRQGEVVDRCVQLHGGYGYMDEYEIARLWRDSRVARIYAGSNEIMKEIVGRSLRLEDPA